MRLSLTRPRALRNAAFKGDSSLTDQVALAGERRGGEENSPFFHGDFQAGLRVAAAETLPLRVQEKGQAAILLRLQVQGYRFGGLVPEAEAEQEPLLLAAPLEGEDALRTAGGADPEETAVPVILLVEGRLAEVELV